MNEHDLRFIKTEQQIEAAFLQLLQQKKYRSITIQDVLETALINRSTFYRHYPNKTALAEKLINDVKTRYQLFLQQRFLQTQPEYLVNFVDDFLTFIYGQKQKILALWQIDTPTLNLYSDMYHLIKTQFIQSAAQQNLGGNVDYQGHMYAHLVLNHLQYALEHDMQIMITNIRHELALMFATARMQNVP